MVEVALAAVRHLGADAGEEGEAEAAFGDVVEDVLDGGVDARGGVEGDAVVGEVEAEVVALDGDADGDGVVAALREAVLDGVAGDFLDGEAADVLGARGEVVGFQPVVDVAGDGGKELQPVGDGPGFFDGRVHAEVVIDDW